MSKKQQLFFLITITLLASCGTQRRLSQTVQKNQELKEYILKSNATLSDLQKQASEQNRHSIADSVLSDTIHHIIQKLREKLDKMGESVSAVELLTEKRSNFRGRNFYTSTVSLINRLDSFQTASGGRDRVYQLLSEAVNAAAFHKFDMGTFFEPGAYKIPLTAVDKIYQPFKPAIDSMMRRSNNYSDIPHKIYMIFVGYADASPVISSGPLYAELKKYLPSGTQPGREALNLTLSRLRANELQRNMKLIIAENASQFHNSNFLDIGYMSYGRGEAFPLKNITDYRVEDERRRVVVFYWSVLPVVE